MSMRQNGAGYTMAKDNRFRRRRAGEAKERKFRFKHTMRTRVYLSAVWAIILSVAVSALAGCARVYTFSARATAMPVFGAEDPEQPSGPPEYSGLIVSVDYDSVTLQSDAALDGVELFPSVATPSTPYDSKSRIAVEVPITGDVRIRQSNNAGAAAEFLDLQPFEIVPGLHADVWLDEGGAAEYIRVYVRVRFVE